MSKQYTITVHAIAEDGLPDMDNLTGRVAFIFDGCVVSGWPLDREEQADVYERAGVEDDAILWEANDDVGYSKPFSGVTHWVEFPVPEWEMEQ